MVKPANDPYRRNPARDLEQYAIRTVATWVGNSGKVVDMSKTGAPDFRIEYVDGRVALGEVGWHQDPREQAMWAAVFKRPRHQVIELADGLGQWGLTLVVGAGIDRLYKCAPSFIASLAAEGRYYLAITGDWPRDELADTARQLGIAHVSQVSQDDPAICMFVFGGDGGMVPTDPNVITDWIEEVLADPAYEDATAKLLVLEADERHVFLMSGSRTSFGADERLRRVDRALPTRSPQVPPGITHVWAIPQFGEAPAAMWALHRGWSAQSLPAD